MGPSSSAVMSPRSKSARRRRRRFDGGELRAYRSPGATRFSSDPEFGDPVFVIRALKQFPHIIDVLIIIQETTVKHRDGRPRSEGSWALVMVAFAMSGHTEYKTFRDSWKSSPIWREAGFLRTPGKSLVWLRLTELESFAGVFERAAWKLIKQARSHDDRIGRFTHLDGSGCASSARAIHDCPDRTACRKHRMRMPAELARARAEEVEAARHDESGLPEDEAQSFVGAPIVWLSPNDPALKGHPRHMRNRYRWFSQNGHLFRVADLTAGARAYAAPGSKGKKTTKFNLGGHLLLAVDSLLDAPLAVHCQGADIQEYADYEDIEEKVAEAIGEHPLAMVVDRGFHIRKVFEHNLSRRVSTISEWRQPHRGIWPETLECEQFDRDGVVRCRHCGDACHAEGPGLGIFLDQRGNPYLRVHCRGEHTEECKKNQRIACSVEPRLLQPINRTHKVFWDLVEAQKNKEGMFMTFRNRYRVGGKDWADKPRRRAVVPVQQLRASVGMFLDWFRICLMHGFLASARHTRSFECKTRGSGGGHWEQVMKRRDDKGLWLPYGKKAHAHGLALDDSIPNQRAGP